MKIWGGGSKILKIGLITIMNDLTLLTSLKKFLKGTNYCGSGENRRRPFAEILYNLVMGFVCIFDYINLKEGPTRLKYFFYYTVLTMEAGILMTVWYIKILEKVSVYITDNSKKF